MGFNRTFMELKSPRAQALMYNKSFNRTFMELKLESTQWVSVSINVLIVPLWNWNSGFAAQEMWRILVLIVPLWNWNTQSNYVEVGMTCFNRTFMELKSAAEAVEKINDFCVLIVPLWNWNPPLSLKGTRHRGFNRTFMELKFGSAWRCYEIKWSFNRTFMELKWVFVLSFYKQDTF